MNDIVEEVEVKKAPAGPAKLIRGRMPLPLVWHIRFKESYDYEDIDEDGNVVIAHQPDSAVARKFFTTAGKIMDIRTNRNFKYLHEGTTFSESDIETAKDQLRKNIAEGKIRGTDTPTNDYDEDDASSMFELLDSMVSETSSIDEDRKAYNEANPRKKKEASVSDEFDEDYSEEVVG